MISIFADGSSGGRYGGAGGYGWVIVKSLGKPDEQVLGWSYGGSPWTTNNLMEMEGAIQGLEAALELGLNAPGQVLELVSDSQYCLGIASGSYTAVKNLEEARQLVDLSTRAGVRFRWVRGHEGDKYNEVCDALAKQGKLENTTAEIRAKTEARKLAQRAKKKAGEA